MILLKVASLWSRLSGVRSVDICKVSLPCPYRNTSSPPPSPGHPFCGAPNLWSFGPCDLAPHKYNKKIRDDKKKEERKELKKEEVYFCVFRTSNCQVIRKYYLGRWSVSKNWLLPPPCFLNSSSFHLPAAAVGRRINKIHILMISDLKW